MGEQVMKCHYEVLGVPMDADADAIRKAYRKSALEWHPDKNMHRIEEATVKFQLISDAYQVLSDPKEREWYDTHRESILRGGDGTFNAGSSENFAPNIYHFFSPQSKATFYEYYSKAFEEINNAERSDAERQGKADPGSLPEFGTKESSPADVKRFYAVWEGFTTKMSFAWMDKYDTREAENRYQRRYVEKLNDSERSGARREYIDAVRSLVEYVKKRDERWAMVLAKQEQEEREKREKREKYEAEKKAAKAAQKEALRKELEEEMAREEEERRRRAAEAGEALEEEASEATEEEDEAQHHVWSCGVCSKDFKSEKQLQNHEGSKKHKDAVKAFLKKGGKLDAVQPSKPPPTPAKSPSKPPSSLPAGLVPCPSCNEPIPSKSETCPKCEMPVFLDDEEAVADDAGAGQEESEEDEDVKPSSSVKKAPAKTNAKPASESEEEDEEESSDDDAVHRFVASQKRKPKVEEVVEEEPEPVAEVDNDDEADGDAMDDEDVAQTKNSASSTPASGSKKIGKAKLKRMEKEARSRAAATEQSTKPLVCAVCGEEFTSRSKLFKHVEDLDHAVPPDQVGNPGNNVDKTGNDKGKGGKKGKKKA